MKLDYCIAHHYQIFHGSVQIAEDSICITPYLRQNSAAFSDIYTKLIKTQSSLHASLQRNIPHVEIYYKTFEKLLRFEQNISEYNLFTDTFVYRRFKCRIKFVQKFIYTDNMYYNPLCSYLISWRETQSGIPDCYYFFWFNFQRTAELH